MNKLIISAAFILAGGLSSQMAFANDLILGFQDTSGNDSTYNYEVDLGASTLFTSLENTGTTVNLTLGSATAGYGAVSTSALASDYPDLTSGSVVFGAAGDGSASQEYLITDLTGVPNRASTQTSIYNYINGLYNGINSGTSTGGTNAYNVPSGTAGSYTSVAGSSGFYDGLSYSTQQTVPSSSSVQLDLYDVLKGSGSSTLVGYFTIDSSGDLSFTGSGVAVPEPSTYVLLALGVVGLYFGTRRKALASV